MSAFATSEATNSRAPREGERPVPVVALKTATTLRSWPRPETTKYSLAFFLTVIVLVVITVATGAIGFQAISIVYDNKVRDTWAILFLELEREAGGVSEKLANYSRAVVPDGSRPHYEIASAKELKKEGIEGRPMLAPVSLIQYDGGVRLIRAKGQGYQLFDAPLDVWLTDSLQASASSVYYLVNRSGQLIYSSKPKLTGANVANRSLVQAFVAAPFRQGQVEFKSRTGHEWFLGYYHEIPGTNLVIFSETPKAFAFAEIRRLLLGFGGFVLFVLFAAIFVLQLPLQATARPLRDLMRLAGEIGGGNFLAEPRYKGFGEIGSLIASFKSMARDLMDRDRRINELLVEQQQRLRLETELEVARSIQDNFLPKGIFARRSGFDIAACYLPASEVAGDWYGHFHDDGLGETVLAVADVSGHGAGSAMFTAAIAGLFVDARASATKGFDCVDFMKRANRVLHVTVQGKWHATMLLVKLHRGEREVEIVAGGHCPPLIVSATGTPRSVNCTSNVLGMEPDFSPHVQKVELKRGQSMVLYSDGLIEGRNVGMKPYGKRTFARVASGEHLSMQGMIDSIVQSWKSHCGAEPSHDDVCIVAIRAE